MPMNSTAPPIANATAPRVICPTFWEASTRARGSTSRLISSVASCRRLAKRPLKGKSTVLVFVHSPLPLLPAQPLTQGLYFDQTLNPSGALGVPGKPEGFPHSRHHAAAYPGRPCSGPAG